MLFPDTSSAAGSNPVKTIKKGHQADGCKTEFCHYDEPHQDYIYTKKWVDFLVEKLKDDQEYENIKLVR